MLKLYIILISHFPQATEAYQRYKPYIDNFFQVENERKTP